MARTGWIWLGLALLAALPLAIAPVPLMADLPNHIARHHILARALLGPTGDPWWTVDWRWIGNLGVDLPAVLLTPLLGAELATRLVVMAIAPLTVLGIVALGRAAHGRVTAGTALALPFALAQPWLYGFANYTLSIALALFVTATWLRRGPDSWPRAIGFAIAALLVWTAHTMGWAILLILIAGAELARTRTLRDGVARALRAVPIAMPLLPMLLWRGGSGAPLFTSAPDPIGEKIAAAATVLKGVAMPLDLAMTALIALGGLIALALARRPWFEPRLGLGAALLLLAFLILPATVLGSWGADLRLAPVVAMIALVAIAPARREWPELWLIAAGAGLLIVRIVAVTWVWASAQPALAARLALLDDPPRAGRIAFVVARPECATPWRLDIDRKLGSYAVPRRDAFTNTLFLIPGADIVNRRQAADARWFDGTQDIACAAPPGALAARLDAFAAAGFETIWIADAQGALPVPPGYQITRRTGRDAILRKDGL